MKRRTYLYEAFKQAGRARAVSIHGYFRLRVCTGVIRFFRDTDNGETISAESADSEETSIDDTGEASLSPSEQSIETEEENASETESGRAAAFALKIKKAVASSDLEGFADLCGYPVYISLESGDGRELETRDDLIALGSDTLFTQKMKDTIAAVQESQLDSYGAGVMMGENGAVVFNDVNGTMMITGINLSD